jgi:hypothetical protein
LQNDEQEEMSLADREEGETLVGPPGEAGEALLCGLYALGSNSGQMVMSPPSATLAIIFMRLSGLRCC